MAFFGLIAPSIFDPSVSSLKIFICLNECPADIPIEIMSDSKLLSASYPFRFVIRQHLYRTFFLFVSMIASNIDDTLGGERGALMENQRHILNLFDEAVPSIFELDNIFAERFHQYLRYSLERNI